LAENRKHHFGGQATVTQVWETLINDPPTLIFLVFAAVLWAFILGFKFGEKIWR